MVVQVLVPQCQGIHPLGNELREGMLDELGIAEVGEAGGEITKDPGCPIELPEEQRPGV